MSAFSEFVDYYKVLEISPNANPDTIERMFRYFAQRYHPDNPATADRSRFEVLVEAHETLRDPVGRAQYDMAHRNQTNARSKFVEEVGDGKGVRQGIDIQNRVLSLLCVKCRQNVGEPGRRFFSTRLSGVALVQAFDRVTARGRVGSRGRSVQRPAGIEHGARRRHPLIPAGACGCTSPRIHTDCMLPLRAPSGLRREGGARELVARWAVCWHRCLRPRSEIGRHSLERSDRVACGSFDDKIAEDRDAKARNDQCCVYPNRPRTRHTESKSEQEENDEVHQID